MKFVVNGGRKLRGEIAVRGSKNAATPIIAATLLTDRPCILENVPLISDVFTLFEIMKSIGSEITWIGERSVRIVNKNIDPAKLDQNLVIKIRSSILIIGPLLARCGKLNISTPGGCQIGVRPIDAHLEAIKDLGGTVKYDEKRDIYSISKPKRSSLRHVILREFSVTATENMLMFGALSAPLRIELCAAEPHVQDLGKFLIALGASIESLGTYDISITKPIKAKGREVRYRIMNDYVEAGTFMALAAATGSLIKVRGTPVEYLVNPMQKLKELGVDLKVDSKGSVLVSGDAKRLVSARVQTLPYPGFGTDLQAPFGALLTQCRGEGYIFDTLYEGRLKYITELVKMGAKAEILDPHRARISGPTKLHGSVVQSLDLRAGATLVIAALVAHGESSLGGVEQIDRGYERIEERLIPLGADIARI